MARRYDYSNMHVDTVAYHYGTAIIAAHCYECKMTFVSVAVTPQGVLHKVKEKFRSHIRTGICDEKKNWRAQQIPFTGAQHLQQETEIKSSGTVRPPVHRPSKPSRKSQVRLLRKID